MEISALKIPKIYAYTEPQYQNTQWQRQTPQGQIIQGKGLIKIGYTTRDVKVRIK